MDTKALRLLLLDPSADDAEAALAALRGGDLRLKLQRVTDQAGLHTALAKGPWDAAITEHAPPRLDAAQVLDALREANPDAPLLVLTRAIPDTQLTALMRGGVSDVVLKDQLARLLPALEREIAAAAERARHRKALQALREIEEKHRAVVQGAREAVCYSQDGMHVDANRAYLDLFGYESAAELEGVPVMNLIDKGDHARFKQHIRKCADRPGAPEEFTAVRKDGERFEIEAAASRVSISGEPCTQLLVADISKRKAVETKLRYLNQHDPLTGLYNRNYFLRELAQALERAKRGDEPRGVVYLDFHDLRRVMQTQGNAPADRFLLAAARKLRELFGPKGVVARYGDHDFAALTQEARPKQLGEMVARLRQVLAAGPLSDSDIPGDFGYRVSFASIAKEMASVQGVMAALYPAPAALAAAAGASTPAPPAPTPPPDAGARTFRRETPPPARLSAQAPPPFASKPAVAKPAETDWGKRIAAAIEGEAFRLIYQPIVNLHADAAEYFEVLVRMIGDDDELIPARLFIPPAEETGQAVAIDQWVIKRSIRTLAELRRQHRKVTFFVNLSTAALQDPKTVVTAQQALRETQLNGKYVVFEINEATLVQHPDSTLAFMRAAANIGCRLCVDNFGRTLPIALAVREAPVEYLKLDGELAMNLPGDSMAQTSLKAVVEVARAMKKKTIAKSVESAEALSVLWELGLDYVQGYYFQEGDAELNYEFEGQAVLSSDHTPSWMADSGKSR